MTKKVFLKSVLVICLIGVTIVFLASLFQGPTNYRKEIMSVAETDITELEQLIENKYGILVYFYDRFSWDCLRAEPEFIDALWPEYTTSGMGVSQLPRIYRCRNDAGGRARSLYNIEQTPTFVLYRDGLEERRLEGRPKSMQAYRDFFSGINSEEEGAQP